MERALNPQNPVRMVRHGRSTCRDEAFATFPGEEYLQRFREKGTIGMRVMVIGASTDREKFGNKAVRAYQQEGHEVFPVNPHTDSIEGIGAFHGIADVPGPIDRAALYVPPDVGETVVKQLAARGDVREVFFNPGSDSDELLDLTDELGLSYVEGCAIRAIDLYPSTL